MAQMLLLFERDGVLRPVERSEKGQFDLSIG